MRSKRISIADICIYAVLLLLSFVCLFPFYYVVIVSIADPIVLLNKPFYVLPFSFNINSYRVLIDEKSIFTSTLISVFITAVGTLLSMLILIMAGYGLSKKEAPLRRFFLIMVLITMFFGGQLIPYYLLIKSLHLVNNLGVLIFPLLVDAFYLIIMKNYFLGVSASLEESAKIDGANDYRILFQIIVPISKPIIASISLFMAVSKWNEWWHAMLFLNDRAKWPMQMMLRETLANLSSSAASSIGRLMLAKYKTMNPLSVRMAAIMVTALPVLLIYPFVQKYFTKGLMIGSLKE